MTLPILTAQLIPAAAAAGMGEVMHHTFVSDYILSCYLKTTLTSSA